MVTQQQSVRQQMLSSISRYNSRYQQPKQYTQAPTSTSQEKVITIVPTKKPTSDGSLFGDQSIQSRQAITPTDINSIQSLSQPVANIPRANLVADNPRYTTYNARYAPRQKSIPVTSQYIYSQSDINKAKAQEAKNKKDYADYLSNLDKYNAAISEFELGNQKAIDQYQIDLADYNAKKAAYDKEVADYNKQLEAYNQEKSAYDAQVAEYNKQQEALTVAEKLYRRAKEGKNPYINQETPLVRKYYNMLEKAEESIKYAYAHGQLTPKEIQKYFGIPIPEQNKINIPIPPEGYQGVSDPNVPGGVYFEKIPNAPTPVFTDQLGQGMSMISKPIPQNIINNPLSPALVNNNIQEKPLLTYGPAPTFGEQYNTAVKDAGYFQGTLNFIGSKLAGTYDYAQQRGLTSSYQQEPIRNLLQVAPKAVYFTETVGIPLAFAKSAEDIFTSSGRARLSNQNLNLEESGWNPTVAKAFTYGMPILGLTAGTLGIQSQVKSLALTREAKLFENAPTLISGTRYETPQGGIDLLTGVKQTAPSFFERNLLGIKPTTYKVQIQQPFYNVGEKAVSLEGGSGMAYKITPNKPIEVVSFETGGRGSSTGTTPRMTTISNGAKITREIPEFESGIGRIFTKKTGQGTLDFVRTDNLVNGNIDLKVYMTGKDLFNQPKVYENFLGLSKEGENNFIGIVGANAEKARMNKITGDISIIGKPKAYGIIKRVEVPGFSEEPGYTFIQGSGGKTSLADSFKQIDKASGQVFKQTESTKATASYVKPLIESGFKNVRSVSPEVKLVDRTSNILMPSKFAGTGQYERYSPSENANIILIPKNNQNKNTNLGGNNFDRLNVGENQFNTAPQGKYNDLGVMGRFNDLGTAKSKLDLEFKNIARPKERTIQNPIQPQRPDESQRQRPKQNQQPAQKFMQSLVPKQPQVPKNPTVSKVPTITTTTTEIKNPIKTPTPIIPPKNKLRNTKVSIGEKLTQAFDIVRRRKGKVETIGKNLPEGKALELGVRSSKSSLSQTFALKPVGYTRQSDINYNVPGNLFGAPKQKRTFITPITFTKRRGTTLTTREERSLLISEKRRSNKFSLF